MVAKSNKQKGIHVHSQKDIFFAKLKILTKILFNNENKDTIKKITTDKQHNEKLKYRLYSYFLNHPRVLKYINTHLNDLFLFNTFSIEDLIITFQYIVKLFNIKSTNELYFSKYKNDEYSNFKKIIDNYYKEKNISNISNSEVQALYLLYCNNIITEEDIDKMKSVIDGKEKKTVHEKKIEQIVNIPSNINQDQSKLADKIIEFNKGVKNFIKERTVCKNCPMYHKGSVILDTNLNEPGQVDVAFVGLNPGEQEYKEDIPFCGPSGNLLHNYLDTFVKKYQLKYVIYNSILCWSKSGKEIPNIKAVTNNCSGIVNEIDKAFPSKIKVLIGADSLKARLGNVGGITKLNGQLIDNYFVMIHPSAILRDPNKMKLFETAWKNLEQLIGQNKTSDKVDQIATVNNSETSNINQSSIINKIDNSLTLFDIITNDEELIYIFIDKEGNKKYLFGEQIQFPIYLKSGDYRQCKFIESFNEIEAVCYLTKEQRLQLNRKLYGNLKNFIK